jgi:hypothetical protein
MDFTEMKTLIVLTCLTLAGCATMPPVEKVVTQRVEIPIAVACKTPTPAEPTYCAPSLKPTDSIFDKTKCLLSDEDLRKANQLELTAALNSCK